MFNKVGVPKFLLCAFSAGFGANLVGHATVGSENIKNTEGDAQKDSNIYVEKVSGELEKILFILMLMKKIVMMIQKAVVKRARKILRSS